MVTKQLRWVWLWARMYRLYKSIKRDPNRRAYTDEALTPVAEDDSDVPGDVPERRGEGLCRPGAPARQGARGAAA
jgi:hypothetical protein